ncbi:MAG: SH3 domain-containing protein [Oscillospiraceae bacterium]|jgi:uncharacterized protein YgiM (DUF1202 family)|nr:SH3 domain-containing protein [Oscillospiraceae bacterium]
MTGNNVRREGKRIIALLVSLAMLLTFLPAIETAYAGTGYYTLTRDAAVYSDPDAESTNYGTLREGQVFTSNSNRVVDGVTWYYLSVRVADGSGNTAMGWVSGSSVRELTQSEVDAINGVTPSPSPAPTSTGSGGGTVTGDGGYIEIKVTSGRVNVREYPAVDAAIIAKVYSGTVMQYTATVKGSDGYTWYRVTVSGKTGYVRSDLAVKVSGPSGGSSSGGSNSGGSSSGGTASATLTVGPNGATVRYGQSESAVGVANLPAGTIVQNLLQITRGDDGYLWYGIQYGELYGFVRGDELVETASSSEPGSSGSSDGSAGGSSGNLTGGVEYIISCKGNANMRGSASMSGSVVARIPQGTRVYSTNTKVDSAGYTWVYCTDGAHTGYIRSDLLTKVSSSTPTVTPSPTPAPDTISSEYVVVLASAPVYSSASADSTLLNNVSPNMIARVDAAVKDAMNVAWYRITVVNSAITGYIMALKVRAALSSELVAGGIVAPTQSPTLPPSAQVPVQVKVGVSRVNLRGGPSTAAAALKVIAPMTTLVCLGTEKDAAGVLWYHVQYYGTTGYIRSDLASPIYSGGSSSTPDPDATYLPPTNDNLMAVASGETNLRSGMGLTFSVVAKMQRGEILEVFSSGIGTDGETWYRVTSRLTGKNGFVRSDLVRKLTASEEAGNAGSSSGGSSEGKGSVGYSLTTVELDSWFTGTIKAQLEVAGTVIVVSCETKQGFRAKYRWGTQHADLEPLTATDTAIAWNIRNSSGTPDRAPVWVIASGRTFASSMYFWEHDTSSDTIKDNNYAGIFCLHFNGSTTHTNTDPNSAVNKEHQASVQRAYGK